MPRGDFNIYFASRRGRGYVRAEEAVGIALLVLILAALLMLGCWYFRKRGGYKKIRSSQPGPQAWSTGQYSEGGAAADNKMARIEFSNLHLAVPNAPPAYEMSSVLPPPYSP